MEEDKKIRGEALEKVGAKAEAFLNLAAAHLDDDQAKELIDKINRGENQGEPIQALGELIHGMDLEEHQGEPVEEAFLDFLAAVKEAAIALGIIQETQEQPEEEEEDQIPRVNVKQTKKGLLNMCGPVEMILEAAVKGEKVKKDLPTLTGSGIKEPTMLSIIEWPDDGSLSCSREITEFDKRVLMVLSAIYRAGNEYTSASQIWKVMTGSKSVPATSKKNVNDSLTKMSTILVSVDNTREEALSKYPLAVFQKYNLIYIEWAEAYINGKYVESAIHILKEPPLNKLARRRNQVEPIPIEVLHTPVEVNENNLKIEVYLLKRIKQKGKKTKDGKKLPYENKIILDTLYDDCGIREYRQSRKRARETVEELLTYYTKTVPKTIHGFSIDGNEIEFYRTSQEREEAERAGKKILPTK